MKRQIIDLQLRNRKENSEKTKKRSFKMITSKNI